MSHGSFIDTVNSARMIAICDFISLCLSLLLAFLGYIVAQAPGDGNELCVSATIDGGPNQFYNDPSSYADNERVLMDSWNYVGLLQESDPTWQNVDNDDNNGEDVITQVCKVNLEF